MSRTGRIGNGARQYTLIGCVVLGLVMVAATAWGGRLDLTGPRWLPPAGLFGGRVPLPAQPSACAQPSQPPHVGGRGDTGSVILTIIAVLAALAIVLFVRRYLRGRATHLRLPAMSSPDDALATPASAEGEQQPDVAVMHRGLQEALDALDDEREPADAVVRAWLGLQAAAEESGVERRSAETPTEFTSRVITRVRADARAAGELVDVYQAVRFGGHPITAVEVSEARSAVRTLLASWHDPVLGRRQ